MPGRRRARDGARRAELLGAVALLLPKVPAPELPRVCGREYQAFVLGPSLLRATASEGQEPPRGGTLAGLQVGADHLQVLADEDGL